MPNPYSSIAEFEKDFKLLGNATPTNKPKAEQTIIWRLQDTPLATLQQWTYQYLDHLQSEKQKKADSKDELLASDAIRTAQDGIAGIEKAMKAVSDSVVKGMVDKERVEDVAIAMDRSIAASQMAAAVIGNIKLVAQDAFLVDLITLVNKGMSSQQIQVDKEFAKTVNKNHYVNEYHPHTKFHKTYDLDGFHSQAFKEVGIAVGGLQGRMMTVKNTAAASSPTASPKSSPSTSPKAESAAAPATPKASPKVSPIAVTKPPSPQQRAVDVKGDVQQKADLFNQLIEKMSHALEEKEPDFLVLTRDLEQAKKAYDVIAKHPEYLGDQTKRVCGENAQVFEALKVEIPKQAALDVAKKDAEPVWDSISSRGRANHS